MPPGVDEAVCLQAVYDDTLRELRGELIRNGSLRIQSFAIILSDEGLAFTVIMEPRRQFQTIRDALHAAAGFGFVHIHDGHVRLSESSEPREALLCVKGSRTAVDGAAYTYTRTPFGMQFDEGHYPAPSSLLDQYREMFSK